MFLTRWYNNTSKVKKVKDSVRGVALGSSVNSNDNNERCGESITRIECDEQESYFHQLDHHTSCTSSPTACAYTLWSWCEPNVFSSRFITWIGRTLAWEKVPKKHLKSISVLLMYIKFTTPIPSANSDPVDDVGVGCGDVMYGRTVRSSAVADDVVVDWWCWCMWNVHYHCCIAAWARTCVGKSDDEMRQQRWVYLLLSL